MTRIIIVDDHPIFRSGLKQIVDQEYDMEVVGEAASALQLYKIVNDRPWDLLILDISLPDENGLEILKDLKCRFKRIAVLFLSNHPESQYGLRALKAGASGYMTKEAAPRELVTAIRKIVGGGRYISESMAEALADSLTQTGVAPGHHHLSDREFQVMRMIGQGKSIKTIAAELNLTVQTVSTYRARVIEKMGLKSNADIIRYLIENNLH